MRRILLYLLFVAISLTSQGQRHMFAGLRAGYSSLQTGHLTSAGLCIDYDFGPRFGVGYNLTLGSDGLGNFYAHSGIGQTITYYGYANYYVDESMAYLLTLSMFLPERFYFYIPIRDRTRVGLYVSPWGFDYLKNNESFSESYELCGEVGLRWFFSPTNNLLVVPEAGIKRTYKTNQAGFSAGISLYFTNSDQ